MKTNAERKGVMIPGDEFLIIPTCGGGGLHEETLPNLLVKVVACDRANKAFTMMFLTDSNEARKNDDQ